jgi:hypothetical protein
LGYPGRGECDHPSPQDGARKGVEVVEVHDAVGRNAIGVGREVEFRHQAASRSCQRGDDNGSDAIGDRIAREHEHRPVATGGRRHLSGPFAQLALADQERAILSLLALRDDIGLPDPRATVPVMADIARRHPSLSLLNLEATAAARVLDAAVWLSPAVASGVLPPVLAVEGLQWRSVELP